MLAAAVRVLEDMRLLLANNDMTDKSDGKTRSDGRREACRRTFDSLLRHTDTVLSACSSSRPHASVPLRGFIQGMTDSMHCDDLLPRDTAADMSGARNDVMWHVVSALKAQHRCATDFDRFRAALEHARLGIC